MPDWLYKRSGVYTGPRCWVPYNMRGQDGKELIGGWHYSTRQWKGLEVADRRLHLNDADPANPFYEYAGKGHESWVTKHGTGRLVKLEGPEE
jgi:hypothetical protein